VATTAEELEARRRLAQQGAAEVDPDEIEGLAPPPTTRPATTRLPTSRIRTLDPSKIQHLGPPPQTAREALVELNDKISRRPKQTGTAREALRELNQRERDSKAGRLETAAASLAEGLAGTLASELEPITAMVIRERQGKGIFSMLGLQDAANAVLGRQITDEEARSAFADISNNPASKFIKEAIDTESLGINPEFFSDPDKPFSLPNFLTTTVPGALGSAAAFLGAAALTKGAGLTRVGQTVAVGALGAAAGASEFGSNVESKGGTADQIWTAMLLGGGVGVSEVAPIAAAFGRMNRGTGGRMLRALKAGGVNSVEELLQESFQQISNNVAAKILLDLDDPIIDRSVAEGGAAGAIAGFIQGALITALGGGGRRGPRKRKKGPAEDALDTADGKNPPGDGEATEELTPEQEGDQNANEIFGVPEEDQEIPRLEGESDVDYLKRRLEIINQQEADRLAEEGQPPADVPPETPPGDAGGAPPPVAPVAPVVPGAPEPEPPAAPAAPVPVAPEPVVPDPEPPPPPVEPTTGDLPEGARAVFPVGAQEGGKNRIRTPSGRQEVDTQFVAIDLDAPITSDNELFPGALQPRERERQAMQEQVNDIVANPAPEQLGVAGTTDTGAPLLNNRGEVISGNGRIAALRRMRTENPEGFARIQAHMSERLGVELGENEVMAQVVLTPMDAQQQADFAADSNTSTGADLSESEQAKIDAPLITPEMLSNFVPGDIDSDANAGFVAAFADSIPPNERNTFMQDTGKVSTKGKARMRAAMLARVLGSTESGRAALKRTLENPDDNTKNITNAVVDATPALLRLQQGIEDGTVPETFGNLASDLAAAVNLISTARQRGMTVTMALAQQDLTEQISPVAEQLVRSFMNANMTRAASRADVAETLTRFAEETLRTTGEAQGDLVGGQPAIPDPVAILAAARASVQPAQQTQGDIFDPAPAQPAEGDQGGQQPPPTAPTQDAAPVAPGEQQPEPGSEPADTGAPAGATPGQPPATAPENVSPQQPEPTSPGAEDEGTGIDALIAKAVETGEPAVQRADTFSSDGAYDVALPTGEVVQIFRDTGQFANPLWHLVDDNSSLSTQGIGSTQAEALAGLPDRIAMSGNEALQIGAEPAEEGEAPGPNDITDMESAQRVFGEILGREITGTGPAVLLAQRRFDDIMALPTPDGQPGNIRADLAALDALAEAEMISDAELSTLANLVLGAGPVQPVGDQLDVENQKEQHYQETPTATEASRMLGNQVLEESAKEAEKNASLPENHPAINTFALVFNRELIKDKVSTIIGKVMNSVKDIAAAVQAYRDPRFETLRYFFLDADNKVIFQTGVSSRLPGSTAMAPFGDPRWLTALVDGMQGKATKVWMMHNHPQHDSDPSDGDLSVTQFLKENYFTPAGISVQHVVVNHNEYSWINNSGIVRRMIKDEALESVDFTKPETGMGHALLGEEVGKVSDLVRISQGLAQPNKITVVGVSGKNKLNAIAAFDVSWLGSEKNLKEIRNQLSDWRAHVGANRIYLAGLPPGTFPIGREGSSASGIFLSSDMTPPLNRIMKNLVRNGLVSDIVDVDGNSGIANNVIRHRPSATSNPLGKDGIQVEFRDTPTTIQSDAEGLNTEATRNQQEVVKRTKQGQPIDRIFRAMWSNLPWVKIITNEAGQDPQWEQGVKAWEGFTDFVVNKKFESENPAASWFNNILHKARFGLIDRYNVPQSAKDINERRRTFQIELVQKGAEFVTRLVEAGVDSVEEGALVQKFLVGELSEDTVTDKEWFDVAVEIRAAVDGLGMQAVMMGLISRESYERNKGTWLHRTYFKDEGYFVADNNSINKWLGQNIKGRAQQIGGEIEKGRGLFLEHTMARILKDVPQEFRDRFTTTIDGKPDPALQDQRFRIIDLIDQGFGDQQDIPGVAEGGRGVKIKRRIFLPADQEVSANLGPYEDRGEFVVRRIRNNGDVVLWRDYTVAEREHNGEIVDARYNIMRSFQLLGRDLANGQFFRSLASNPEWTWDTDIGGPTPPEAVIAKSADTVRGYIGAEWVLVPDTKIGKTANVKRWGDLAGKYIKAEIWNDISQLAEMRTPGMWDKMLTTWKLNKTALNPVVHTNNVMSNLGLMDVIDVRMSDLVEGTMMRIAPMILNTPKLSQFHGLARKYQNDELLNQMRAYGAFGHSMVDIDLSNELLTPIVAELQRMIDGGKGVNNTFLAKGKMMWTLSKLWTTINNALVAQKGLYRLEDEVFRAATVLRKLEQGYSMQDASVMAREQFLNYDIRAPWINAGRRSVFPFISYTYRAVPALAEAIARRPWKLAKYITLAEIANSLAYAISDGEEEYERGSLRTQAQGSLSFGLFNTGWIPGGGIPRMMRLPTNDEFGRAQFLDVRRWVPAGDVFDLHSANPLPIPSWLQFSGPLMVAAELYMNKSAFTGQQISDPLSSNWADKTKEYGSFAYQAIMPSAPWIPMSWYWNRIKETAKGTTDPLGRTNSTTQATLQAFGLKVSSQDPELGYTYKAIEFDNTQRAYAARLNNAARRLARGHMTQADFETEQATIMRRLKTLAKNREEAFQPYLNRGPASAEINME
jgi:DNA repair protein RadC